MRGLGLCRILIEAGIDAPLSKWPPIAQVGKTIAARRRFFRSQEHVDSIPIICDGWAAVAEFLPNGRRQILSFLLPGELLSSSTLFESCVDHDVEALTPICYRLFDRAGLWERLVTDPKALSSFVNDCAEEKHRLDELVLDLGRRKAHQRIARLILELMDRLARRSAVREPTFNFPLRQSQIADATGVTAAYVNQVLKGFRGKRLIKLEKRSLTVLDVARLRRLIDE